MRFIRSSNTLRLFLRNMNILSIEPIPSMDVRGMTVLDQLKFRRSISVPVLKVNEDKLHKITKVCKPYFIKLEKFKPVQNLSGGIFKKCIYLTPEKIHSWTDFSEDTRNSLSENGVDENNLSTLEVLLGYDNWKFEQIFKAVLPEDSDTVSGFSQIGHIIHLNLRDHLLEYKQLIGQVLLDKIKTCRTVVNKSNIIDNTYRNFSMEVIAGIKDFLVTVKENNCNFQFDFSKVYWNSRLCKEHERILTLMKPKDVLFDIFCGVGPFSIPAAKRKVKVYANDLNPDSYYWLNHNAKQNKVNLSNFKSFNLDGKDFIQTIFKDYLIDVTKGCENLDQGAKIHVTMNLPALAVDFLKYFNGLLNMKEYESFNADIIVYVYTFVVGEDLSTIIADAKQIVCDKLGYDISSNITDVFDVRNVSPKKEMMRVTFNLTREVLFNESVNCEPPSKKQCFNT